MIAALLTALMSINAHGAEASLPKKFHGDWSFSPGNCHSKIIENDGGVRITASSLLAFKDACQVVRIVEDKGYAIKALFQCEQTDLSAQRTITLKLGTDAARLRLDDTHLFRCEAVPPRAAAGN